MCQNLKRCQVVKKMSNVKKSNTWTMEEVHKKSIDIMRFTDIDINFDIIYMMIIKNLQNVHGKYF